MTGDLLGDAVETLTWTRVLLAFWLVLSLSQWLVIARQFAPDGLLPRGRMKRAPSQAATVGGHRLLSPGPMRGFFAVQLLLAIVLAVSDSGPVAIGCLVVLIACQAVFTVLTGHFWADGSDKIGIIVMAGTLLAFIGVAIGDPGVILAGILLTGGQLVISYFVAGVSKMFVPAWRDGTRLKAILSTRAWGSERLAGGLKVPGFAAAAAWAVILLEALFPLALLAPQAWLLLALGAMLAFHFATAFLMGLNKFPWAFAAAYPSVILLGRVVRSAVGAD